MQAIACNSYIFHEYRHEKIYGIISGGVNIMNMLFWREFLKGIWASPELKLFKKFFDDRNEKKK